MHKIGIVVRNRWFYFAKKTDCCKDCHQVDEVNLILLIFILRRNTSINGLVEVMRATEKQKRIRLGLTSEIVEFTLLRKRIVGKTDTESMKWMLCTEMQKHIRLGLTSEIDDDIAKKMDWCNDCHQSDETKAMYGEVEMHKFVIDARNCWLLLLRKSILRSHLLSWLLIDVSLPPSPRWYGLRRSRNPWDLDRR